MADIFRKKSLEKLSSPEQLDKMIVINSPMTWLALAGGIFIIAAALLWGILGSVPMTEEGSGILLRNGELNSVYARTQGVVTKAHVTSGDVVEKGDVLFEVDSKQTALMVQELRNRIAGVEAVTFTSSNDAVTSDNQVLIDIKNQKPSLSLENSAQTAQLKELNKQYSSKQQEVASLEKKLEKAKNNYAENPTDPAAQGEVELALSEYNTAKAEAKSLRTEIASAEVQVSVGANAESVQRDTLQRQFNSTKEATLDKLRKELNQYNALRNGMEIKATVDGVIYTTFVTNGSAVSVDMEVARISKPGKDGKLQAVYYMPIASGKKIEQDMKVNIYPSTYAKEEYGHMTGTVTNVANYVTSYADLYTRVGDSTLAQTFTKSGAVVEVVCEIDSDENTASGYAWSSKKGETVELKEGTPLGGSIVTEDVRPITMLVPKLKEKFSMDMKTKAAAAAMSN